MGLDDDAGCPAHEWVLVEMNLGHEGATMHYECKWCSTFLVRAPDEMFPA